MPVSPDKSRWLFVAFLGAIAFMLLLTFVRVFIFRDYVVLEVFDEEMSIEGAVIDPNQEEELSTENQRME
jgi:hypothetical protein